MISRLGPTLLIATHNGGKLEEFRAILGPRGLSVRSSAELDLPEPRETEDSFVGNARIKARAALGETGLPVLADDSGLEIDALGGAPGVYTADWATTPAGRDFGLAMRRAHEALLSASAEPPWRARFACTLVLALPGGAEHVFEGHVSGRIVWPPRGPLGHGYDPVFVADGETRTFAELPPERKNAISHRSRAIGKLLDWLDDEATRRARA
jgi:XTP/dITP diphosphohydrolase